MYCVRRLIRVTALAKTHSPRSAPSRLSPPIPNIGGVVPNAREVPQRQKTAVLLTAAALSSEQYSLKELGKLEVANAPLLFRR